MVLSTADPSAEAMGPLPLLPTQRGPSLCIPISVHTCCAVSHLSRIPRLSLSPLHPSADNALFSLLSLRQNSSKELLHWLFPLRPLPFSLEPVAVKLSLSTLHQTAHLKVTTGLHVAKSNGEFSGSFLLKLSGFNCFKLTVDEAGSNTAS